MSEQFPSASGGQRLQFDVAVDRLIEIDGDPLGQRGDPLRGSRQAEATASSATASRWPPGLRPLEIECSLTYVVSAHSLRRAVMFIRHAITTFLEVESEALAPARAPVDWTLDWRWFSEPAPNDALPNDALQSEGSLINWPSWARLTTPRHG